MSYVILLKEMKQEIAKILIDLAKMVFAGVILGGLMRQDIPSVWLFTLGGTATLIIMAVGLFLSWQDKKYNSNN
jgi:uncharacterized membrane protein YraQ (UPF0718 family)